jgi:hypothetical protein
MGGEAFTGKRANAPDALSGRDRLICDGFLSGQSRKQLAEKYEVTPQRIGQVLHQPAAIIYLIQKGGNTKALLYAKVGEEILARTEWGGMRLDDLVSVWKAAMPKELALTITDRRAEAEAIAAEIGKGDDPAVVAQIEQDLLISQQPTR